MRFAVDRFVAGKEKEVAASDFYGKTIPRRHDRFFCPECNEPVHWRDRSASKSEYFAHNKKTDRSPECDKRVDGRSDLSLNQRVGLSLYLSHEFNGVFNLNLVFPSLGTQLFDKLYADQTIVRITAGNTREKTVSVTPTNFYRDQATLVPIDFIPNCGRNYEISFSSTRWNYSINKKWSVYSDGFESQGGVFKYTEHGGKKVRRGDSIEINQKYYLVSKQYSSPYHEIEIKRVGSIYLNRLNYSVYEMEVNSNVSDESRFNLINNYLKRTFGIWLLEKVPDLIPLWPPVVERDMLSPIIQTGSSFCAVISTNENPKVFTYIADNVRELSVTQHNGCGTVSIPTNNDVAVSVDRKYVGRELAFSKEQVHISGAEVEFWLADTEGSILNEHNITSKSIESGFEVFANTKAELYVQSYDNVYQRVEIRKKQVQVSELRYPYSVILVSEGVIIKKLLVKRPLKKTKEEQELDISVLSKHDHGAYVPIPIQISPVFKSNIELKKLIKNGKVRRGVLTWLLSNKEAIK